MVRAEESHAQDWAGLGWTGHFEHPNTSSKHLDVVEKHLLNYQTFILSLFAVSIGYPVVYLGFDATCYFTSLFKLRTQKAVQSENEFHMHLLQQSLPSGLQLYPKSVTDGNGSKRNTFVLTSSSTLDSH